MRCARTTAFILALLTLTGVAGKAQKVQVPFGKQVSVDGKIEAAEWADAAQHDLTNGGKLFAKYDGKYLYFAMRGTKAGWSHLYLSEGSGSDIAVKHASAALGKVIYRRDNAAFWQPANNFTWELRDLSITAETRSSMESYLDKNGWVASNNNMGNPSEVEYKLPVAAGREVRIAAVFISDGISPQHFPASLADDTVKRELLSGATPRNLKFDVTKWASLQLPAAKTASLAAGLWKGEVMRGGREWRVAVKIEPSSARVDFLDLDVADVSFPLYTSNANGIRLEKPQPSGMPIVFDGRVADGQFSGGWKGFGVDGRFLLKRAKAEPKSFREEEISFANGDVSLSGTLLLPNGKAKNPAVVLVHGSSPNERTAYRSWARRFAESGVAALVYDKRGSGKSTGNTRAASMENLADDALAGIRMLKLRRDIDAGKVGIAGHSQGGWIAPLAAARSGDVAFVMISGAAAVTPAEQSIYHRAGVMRAAGISESEITEATKLREKLYLLNRKILANDPDVMEFRKSLSNELIANKDARWFSPAELPPELTGDLPPRGALELLFFDAASVWPKVKVPVLAMWGERDAVVPVEKSGDLIKMHLEQAGNKDLTIKMMPGVDHGNNIVSTGGEWDFPRANKDYYQTMIEWLSKRVG